MHRVSSARPENSSTAGSPACPKDREGGQDGRAHLVRAIKRWGMELGFQQVGITGIDLADAERRLLDWLARGYHGEMGYMQRHGLKRSRPAELVPGTLSVICAGMDYYPPDGASPEAVLGNPELAYVSRYALGRDYHKLMRSRLTLLARRIAQAAGPFGHRVFTDSAPVLEKALAEKAGLGWIGKHSCLLQKRTGSWFFLGEIYTDLALPPDGPPDAPASSHCGTCRACMDACPTGAIVGPYQIDARRCISYLTIELRGAIPIELRPLLGNRIYGCDDCQLACPWNRFARPTTERDLRPRHGLDSSRLVDLFRWSEAEFLAYTEGMAIRRAGYVGWLRNIAVALGNAPHSIGAVRALEERRDHPSGLVREHGAWALQQQDEKRICGAEAANQSHTGRS
jgi:epoxyqueuosine reductase